MGLLSSCFQLPIERKEKPSSFIKLSIPSTDTQAFSKREKERTSSSRSLGQANSEDKLNIAIQSCEEKREPLDSYGVDVQFSTRRCASLVDLCGDQNTKIFSFKREIHTTHTSSWNCVSHRSVNVGTFRSMLSDESYSTYVTHTPITKILPSLYLGSKEDSFMVDKLKELGITHILMVCSGYQYAVHGCSLLTVPMCDRGKSALDDIMGKTFGFMEEAQQNGNKLLVHCNMGQNRSPALVIAWLMTKWKKSLHHVYNYVKEHRRLVQPHCEYIKQLRDLDMRLFGVYSVKPAFLSLSILNGIPKLADEEWTANQSMDYILSQLERENTLSCSGDTSRNSLEAERSEILNEIKNNDETDRSVTATEEFDDALLLCTADTSSCGDQSNADTTSECVDRMMVLPREEKKVREISLSDSPTCDIFINQRVGSASWK